MWMGATHFLMRRFKNVSTEISLHVLAYNLKRMMSIWGTEGLAVSCGSNTASKTALAPDNKPTALNATSLKPEQSLHTNHSKYSQQQGYVASLAAG